MKQLYALLFLALSFAANAQQEFTLTMNYQDSTRSFIVHLPPQYTAGSSLPLVFNLHGYGSNASQEIFYTRMDLTANTNGFICVFPDGLSNAWNSGFGGTGPYHSGIDDVGFVSKMIDTVYQLYGCDLTRVYACGMSNGGYQSYRLACELENRIAAIASVTGTLTDSTAFYCALSRRVPILEIHGTADPLVPYNGSAGSYAVEDLINFWLNKDQCVNESDTTNIPDINVNDSSTVQRIRYSNCGNGTRVWFDKVTGGGHSWPGASIPFIYGPTNQDLNASQEIWNFFKGFTLNGPVGLEETTFDKLQWSIYPNPISASLTINAANLSETTQVDLLDITGRSLQSGNLNNGQALLNTASLPAGIYFVRLSSANFSQVKKIVKE